ncbi:MAG: hypothetical protein AAF609_12350 [Cyanobacteria bacterium P01_C01_bin.120]
MSKPLNAPEPAASAWDEELPTGPGASFTFLYYLVTAGVITNLFTARLYGVNAVTLFPEAAGLAGGAIAGLLGVFFNRSQTLTVPFTSKKQFRRQLNDVMASMGYALEDTNGTIERYQKPNASRWFAGDIFVQQRDQTAVFVSRVSNIRAVKRRLVKE